MAKGAGVRIGLVVAYIAAAVGLGGCELQQPVDQTQPQQQQSAEQSAKQQTLDSIIATATAVSTADEVEVNFTYEGDVPASIVVNTSSGPLNLPITFLGLDGLNNPIYSVTLPTEYIPDFGELPGNIEGLLALYIGDQQVDVNLVLDYQIMPTPTAQPSPTADYCTIGDLVSDASTAVESLATDETPLYTAESGAGPDATDTIWLDYDKRIINVNTSLASYLDNCTDLGQPQYMLQELDAETGKPTGRIYAVDYEDDQIVINTGLKGFGYNGESFNSIAMGSGIGKIYRLVAGFEGEFEGDNLAEYQPVLGTLIKIRYRAKPTSVPNNSNNTGGGGNLPPQPTEDPRTKGND